MEDERGVYERMYIGEEGRPQGVWSGGMRARGVNGGDGRAPRPVPPIIAMGTRSFKHQYALQKTCRVSYVT